MQDSPIVRGRGGIKKNSSKTINKHLELNGFSKESVYDRTR